MQQKYIGFKSGITQSLGTCSSQKTWHLGERKTLEEVKQCYFSHD
jgi:hypothetical protein